MLSNPVAIVTAASKGMGAACAKELAARGYHLVLMARSGSVIDLAEELGGIALTGSLTEPTDLERLVKLSVDTYGRIDAVVNNTGHPARGDLLQLTDQQWQAGLDLLLLNVIRMVRLVTPVMEKQQAGSIVNISTYAALEPSLTFPISASIRAALASFTKLFAERYAKANIRMNNILPGYIDSYQVSDDIRNNIPMGRAGRVDEVAKAVAFLLSSDAGYITGQNIRIDGGLSRSL